MILLIIHPKTATTAIQEGIDLCISVVIPSLFPFFFISALLNNLLTGMRIPGLNRLCKLLRIPEGGEALILLGLLGGYPVGAKMIGQAYEDGKLETDSAKCMLSYCNNAGPAFIFGIASNLFPSILYPFLLWFIHILSAILTGLILPKPTQPKVSLNKSNSMTVTDALQNSIKVTAIVCGWIIIFKVILAYIFLGTAVQQINWVKVLIGGFVELSNGCIQLTQMDTPFLQFILCSCYLAFGGLCVLLQTSSVIGDLDIRPYLSGKCIQLFISMLLAAFTALLLFL